MADNNTARTVQFLQTLSRLIMHRDSETTRTVVCLSQKQKAVSQFCAAVKFGDEDIWIGARRIKEDWTWLRHIPLAGYQFGVNPFNASCSKLLLFEGFSAILV